MFAKCDEKIQRIDAKLDVGQISEQVTVEGLAIADETSRFSSSPAGRNWRSARARNWLPDTKVQELVTEGSEIGVR